MSIKRLTNTGDTIVEVLIAIAVVSAVLGGAFVSANRSLNGSRQAQERAEATKFVEGQLERLKQAGRSNPTVLTATTPNPFCLSNDLSARRALGDAACNQGPDGRYRLSIQKAGDNYTASATWDRIGGGGQDRIIIVYRTY